MGYLHIDNLYKNQAILQHKECYALEKVHGTSAHIHWNGTTLRFFAGGCKHDAFVQLFDQERLAFLLQDQNDITIYGEAYGGKINKQAWRYGNSLRFVAFDVKLADRWTEVPTADTLCRSLGLDFVDWVRISTSLENIDAERDKPSTESVKAGITEPCRREGVVLRPILEETDSRGNRLIVKHKRDEERETNSPRPVIDLDRLAVLTGASAIAEEWVTETRLEHVLDKLPQETEDTSAVIKAMVEDIRREASTEIIFSTEVGKAIATKTAKLHRAKLREAL